MNSSVISFFVGLSVGACLAILIMPMFINSHRLSEYEEEQEKCEK